MFKVRDEQLKDFKKLIRITKKLITIVEERNSLKKSITTETKKVQKKVAILEKTIKEYVKYIKLQAYEFNHFRLTQEEYKLCECDDLSIFFIILIFKKEIKDINDSKIAECILLDFDCKFYFRRRIFLYENVIRTVLTQKINDQFNRNFSTKMWEKEEDILYYPIFAEFDFESFAELL